MSDPFIGQLVTLPFSFAPIDWAACNGQTLPVPQNQALLALLGATYGGDGRNTIGVPNLCGRMVVGSGVDASGHNWAWGTSGGTPQQALTLANMPAHTHSATFTPSASSNATVNATVTGTLNTAVTLSANYNAVSANANATAPAANLSLGIGQPGSVKIYTSSSGTAVSIGTVTANGNVTGALSVAATGSYPVSNGGVVGVAATGSGAPFSIVPPYVAMTVAIATNGIWPSRP